MFLPWNKTFNCFIFIDTIFLFSEDEIRFKLPRLFRLSVALNYSLNFSIRLLYRHQCKSDVKCEASSDIYLGVIFTKEKSSQFTPGKSCFTLQHYKGIIQLLRRKFCGMWGGKRQERRMIQLEKKKENGEGRTNLFSGNYADQGVGTARR